MKIGTTVEFDAAHFVQTTETKCQRLHGHRWVVEVEIEGEPDDTGMVEDFGEIKRSVGLLDHKVILPGESQDVDISNDISHCPDGGMIVKLIEVNVVRKSGERVMYTFPKDDCVVIPGTDVITAENLASVILNTLRITLGRHESWLKVKVYESPRSWAEV